MRKALKLLAVISAAVGLAGCSKGGVKYQPPANQSVYYQKGYDCGYKVGYENTFVGKEFAVLKSLKEWERDRLALYAGKTLTEEGALTPPVLYREGESGGFSYEVGGSRPVLDRDYLLVGVYAPPLKDPALNLPFSFKDLKKECVPPTMNPIASTAYLQGRQKGYADGSKRAEREAIPFLLSAVRRSEAVVELKKIESGKFYSPTFSLTYPYVFSTADNGRTIKKARIEPLLSLEQIFSYTPPFKEEQELNQSQQGVALAGWQPFNFPSQRRLKQVKVEVDSSAVNKLQLLKIPFKKTADGKVIAYFKDLLEAESICKLYSFCKNIDP